MAMKKHTRLDLVEGGNIFKQGDYVTLGFIPRDYTGASVDLTNKQIEGSIFNENTGVIYEGPASFVDGKIFFTIKQVLNDGKFQLEFTVTDTADPEYRTKFPTDDYASELTIKPSADNLDYVGVSMTTVAQLRKEISDASASFTKDGEVILARMGEDSLRDYNEKVKQQLDESVKKSDAGILNLNIFDESTRSAIQGLAPGEINAVLGPKNVKTENIDDPVFEHVKRLAGAVNVEAGTENIFPTDPTLFRGADYSIADDGAITLTATGTPSFFVGTVYNLQLKEVRKISLYIKALSVLPTGARLWYRFTTIGGATVGTANNYFDGELVGGKYLQQDITVPATADRVAVTVDLRTAAVGSSFKFEPPKVIAARYIGIEIDRTEFSKAAYSYAIEQNIRDSSKKNYVWGGLNSTATVAEIQAAATADPYMVNLIQSGVTRMGTAFRVEKNGFFFYKLAPVEGMAVEQSVSAIFSVEKMPQWGKLELRFADNATATGTTIQQLNLNHLGGNWYGVENITVPAGTLSIELRVDGRPIATGEYIEFSKMAIVQGETISPGIFSNVESLGKDVVKVANDVSNLYKTYSSQLFPEPAIQSVNWINYGVLGGAASGGTASFERIDGVGHVVIKPEAKTTLQATGYDLTLPSDVKAGDVVNLVIDLAQVNITDGTFTFVMLPLNGSGTEITGNRFTTPLNAARIIERVYTLPAGADKIRLRFDVTTPGANTNQAVKLKKISVTKAAPSMLPEDLANWRMFETKRLINAAMQGAGNGTVKYVALNGSDMNQGDSMVSALATVNRAFALGADTVFVERGTYMQSVKVNGKNKVTILPYGFDVWNQEQPDVTKVVFKGADQLAGWTAEGSLYTVPYSGNSFFDAVFISKTSPPESTGTRPTYNAALWEGNDKETDTKLKPVLTLVECQAEQGTFFYDGTKIFLNPNDGTIAGKEYNATRLGAGVDVSSNAEVIIADIVADFFQSLPMNIRDIQRIGAQNCEAGHGTATDGFTIDRTNGVLANCKAYKNRNDGFNLHGYGDTIIFHCDGFNNYDDGISHHDGCHGVIVGGNWYGNHKGGIIPTYGASVHVHGATCWGNNFGIYIGGAAYSKRRSVVVRDCKVFENNVGVLISTGYHADIDNVLAERNGTGISFVGDASGKVSRSIMADNIDNGCSLSTSKDVDLNDSKMTDNNRGINKTGTGHLGLKRNHVLYNEIAGISVIAGTVSIDKRNNLHGNVVDYEGGILTPEQKEMNVSFPSI